MKNLSPMSMLAVVAAMSIVAIAADTTNAVVVSASPAKTQRKRPVRRSTEKLEEVSASAMAVSAAKPAPVMQPTAATVDSAFAVQLAQTSSAEVAAEVAAALASASEAQVPAILAALESRISSMTVPDVQRVIEVAVRDKWYERFVAVPGSKLYWIIKIAKEKAASGKNVDDLERAFYKTLQDWAKETE